MESSGNTSPNPFVPEKGVNYPTTRPKGPEQADSAKQIVAKRRALRQWYQDRQDSLRLRLQNRADQKNKAVNAEQANFEVMGRWAINQALTHETDPTKRRSRRQFLMRRWRTFMRQTFHPGSV